MKAAVTWATPDVGFEPCDKIFYFCNDPVAGEISAKVLI